MIVGVLVDVVECVHVVEDFASDVFPVLVSIVDVGVLYVDD
jgi:hypothetical protein